jgi:hypothetical protein
MAGLESLLSAPERVIPEAVRVKQKRPRDPRKLEMPRTGNVCQGKLPIERRTNLRERPWGLGCLRFLELISGHHVL